MNTYIFRYNHGEVYFLVDARSLDEARDFHLKRYLDGEPTVHVRADINTNCMDPRLIQCEDMVERSTTGPSPGFTVEAIIQRQKQTFEAAQDVLNMAITTPEECAKVELLDDLEEEFEIDTREPGPYSLGEADPFEDGTSEPVRERQFESNVEKSTITGSNRVLKRGKTWGPGQPESSGDRAAKAFPRPEAAPLAPSTDDGRETSYDSGKAAPDGFYTVVFETDDYRTIKLETQAPDASFMPGEQTVSFISGPDNESDYTSAGLLKDDGRFISWKKFRNQPIDYLLQECCQAIIGDPEHAGKAYALRSGRCWRCRRTLTTPDSIAAGIGPVCASRLGM